ncbi:hypothetical protein [Pajaroellobacter abortibovis]|uniref:Phosphodiester glycosidase domain-containing protein n=1 Tax=Pajaroellobacter abortibovis TaxID=1882918 RepID=A0A1L6MYR0_9BACT|nr:hypothetical protein [Pajaroellobacter abortibovis]APS00609.1 hypothetical protein BCY86_07935 [Pajaroellobacter abortibovis]
MMTSLYRPKSTSQEKNSLLLPLFCGGGLLGLLVFLFVSRLPDQNVQGLVRILEQASHVQVHASSIRWAPSQGLFRDCWNGRSLFFLGSESDRLRDVWSARVRIGPNGRLLGVAGIYNLTSTELGDEYALVLKGRWVAFATLAYHQVQSVTVFDRAGEDAQRLEEGLTDRWARSLTNYQRTGSTAGMGKLTISFEQPPRQIGLFLEDSQLRLEWMEQDGFHQEVANLEKGEFVSEGRGVQIDRAEPVQKQLIHWLVDTVRSVSWIGPAPIAWLEERFFGARDWLRRFCFWWGKGEPSLASSEKEEKPSTFPLHPELSDAEGKGWPPPPIESVWSSPEPDEGRWKVPPIPWIRSLSIGDIKAPPPFFQTFVRPDKQRSYVKVFLVVMDMRQLELEMEGGSEDPKPSLGPFGLGRIPRDPAISRRVLAAFNGAFKSEHGYYGMMVHRRILLPPQPNAATVAVLSDKRVAMGTWGPVETLNGFAGIDPSQIVSLRQNLDPLVDHFEVNPTKRGLWGYTLPGTGVQTERSAVGLTEGGHLLYAWSDDASATTLGRGMKMAGCVYGIHLDMNPKNTGFLFAAIEDLKGRRYRTALLNPLMGIAANRYIEHASKDFFYLLLRDPIPPPLPGLTPVDAKEPFWSVSPGTQSSPSWLPALWSARILWDQDPVEILQVVPGRVRFRLQLGSKEPDPKTGVSRPSPIREDSSAHILASVGMGFSTDRDMYGIAVRGMQFLPFLQNKAARTDMHRALLVADTDGKLAIHPSEEGFQLLPGTDAIELPLLVDGGNPIISELHGSNPIQQVQRTALGLTEKGQVLIARGSVAPSALAKILARAGCSHAVLFNRGGSAEGFLHRTGTNHPPLIRYPESALYMIATTMLPNAFHASPFSSPLPP